MSGPVSEIALTESPSMRASMAGRTEALDKVKALALMPDDVHVTTEMIAAYYEVTPEAIKSLVLRHRDELAANGLRTVRGTELREFKRSTEVQPASLSDRVNALTVFTRRTVLNVGMLLAVSPVAKQVRTYLLDAEAPELSRLEILTMAIESERGRLEALVRADVAEKQIAVLEGPARSWDVLASADGDYSVRDSGFILNRDPNIDTGEKRLFAILRNKRMIGKDGRPYANHSARLRLRPRSYPHPESGELIVAKPQVRVTVRGLEYLHRELGGVVNIHHHIAAHQLAIGEIAQLEAAVQLTTDGGA